MTVNYITDGSQSFIVIISRFFLIFMVTCVGSYVREYYLTLNKREKHSISIKKVIIGSLIPSFITLSLFDDIAKKINLEAVLLLSCILGFMSYDILKYLVQVSKKNIISVLRELIPQLKSLNTDSTLVKILKFILDVLENNSKKK